MINICDLSINERIALFRKDKGLSQAELGKCLGLKPSTYSQKEREGKFDGEALKIIADVLETDIRILLYGSLKTDDELYREIYEKIKTEFEQKYAVINFVPKKDLKLLKLLYSMNSKKRNAVFQYMLDVFYKRIKI